LRKEATLTIGSMVSAMGMGMLVHARELGQRRLAGLGPSGNAGRGEWATRDEKRAWARCQAAEEKKARPECWAETE
jgi:hypothetical protein